MFLGGSINNEALVGTLAGHCPVPPTRRNAREYPQGLFRYWDLEMDYKKRYDALVEKGRFRKKSDVPYHSHHILPSWLGGGDEKANLVDLTLREHFVAHVLLAKWLKTKEAWAAVKIMGEGFGFRSSRFYEKAMFDFSVNNPNKSAENRERISIRMREQNPMSRQEAVDKMKKSQKARYEADPELRKLVSGDNSPTRRPEVRAKMSESAKARFAKKEERELASVRTKKYFESIKESKDV